MERKVSVVNGKTKGKGNDAISVLTKAYSDVDGWDHTTIPYNNLNPGTDESYEQMLRNLNNSNRIPLEKRERGKMSRTLIQERDERNAQRGRDLKSSENDLQSPCQSDTRQCSMGNTETKFNKHVAHVKTVKLTKLM